MDTDLTVDRLDEVGWNLEADQFVIVGSSELAVVARRRVKSLGGVPEQVEVDSALGFDEWKLRTGPAVPPAGLEEVQDG